MKQTNEILHGAITRLLQPLARILLRHNISFLTFCDLAKQIFIKVAEEEFPLSGRKQSVSRIAMLTGLSRKEVLRVKRIPNSSDGEAVAKQGRSIRVINGWTHDRRFLDEDGNPLVLDFDGPDPNFCSLVRLHSGDITPRAVLDELLRVGLTEVTRDGRVRLISTVYVPRAGILEKLTILGVETADLLNTIDHNIHAENGDPHFQRKVCYYRFPARHLPELKKLASKKSQALLEELNAWMAQHDDADQSGSNEAVRRAGMSLYYFEGPAEDDHAHPDK
ncbi:MAG: hypothetical protein H7Y05_12010 [Steroidobacteraceae bacterium]|nr:hypothetical protein [Deltaproteobacteria bacterium]